MHRRGTVILRREENDDRDNEGVDGDRFGQRRTDDHRGSDRAFSFRVAPKRFHRAANRHTDTERGAKTTNGDSNRCGHYLCRLCVHCAFLLAPTPGRLLTRDWERLAAALSRSLT